ncbi:MAG TPA: asparaginase [Vampirovibrionales bacterium]
MTRADSIESKHWGSYALFQEGQVNGSNPKFANRSICIRSSAKPFQAFTCLKLGVELNNKQLAICSGSHSGSAEHTNLLLELLQESTIKSEELHCGEHQPLDPETPYANKGSTRRRLQNNCSGKHIMMLMACKLKGWPTNNYESLEHPLQKEIIKDLANLCNVEESSIGLGLDGCGLPTYTFKVKDFLLGFSKLSSHSGNKHLQQLTKAFSEEPFFVTGKNRLDYEITKLYKGQLICKSGAGGLSVISFQNTTKPSSLILKMVDGNERVRAVILRKILNKFKLVNESLENKQTSSSYFSSDINNLHGQTASQIELNI